MQNSINQILDYGKDIKINLQNLLSEQNQLLTAFQIQGIILACAYTTKNSQLIKIIQNEVNDKLTLQEINAVKIATSLMAMNNIYYRFTHLIEDKEYLQMPAGLRMKMLFEHNIDKNTFEIFSLAVSIITGCGMCIDAHANQLIKNGINKSQIQMVAKIASVVNAWSQILTIEDNN
jgi:alkyl hydroperoxide reductase subunit D